MNPQRNSRKTLRHVFGSNLACRCSEVHDVSRTAFDSDVRVSKMKALCQISASLPLPGICEQQPRPAACLCQRETRRGIKRRWEKVVAWREHCLCPSQTPLAWISTRELSAVGDIAAHPSTSQFIPAHPNLCQDVSADPSMSQLIPAHPCNIPSHSSMCQLIPVYPSSSQHVPAHPGTSQLIPARRLFRDKRDRDELLDIQAARPCRHLPQHALCLAKIDGEATRVR